MKMNRRTRISAWVLLAAFLPLLVVSSVHTHRLPSSEAEVCHQCVAHEAHPAHLGVPVVSVHDCVFCHLMSFYYLGSAALLVAVLLPVCLAGSMGLPSAVVAGRVGLPGLRAPPCC
ncbi:MAG: hypothetical protein J6V98_00220 [Bacteroidales bacterium]|nr:hypothetical protein [Bacteroidales bacterium]